jgi:hypothetical protein
LPIAFLTPLAAVQDLDEQIVAFHITNANATGAVAHYNFSCRWEQELKPVSPYHGHAARSAAIVSRMKRMPAEIEADNVARQGHSPRHRPG